jgi:DNA-binding response OmpR family regulator
MNILLVDDQPHMEDLLADELSHDGHTLERIGNSNHVIPYLEEIHTDLVLLDLYLKGFEGWFVLSDIKASLPNIPVVILSAYDNFKDDSRLVLADGYLIKNFDIADTVRALMRRIFGSETKGGLENTPAEKVSHSMR